MTLPCEAVPSDRGRHLGDPQVVPRLVQAAPSAQPPRKARRRSPGRTGTTRARPASASPRRPRPAPLERRAPPRSAFPRCAGRCTGRAATSGPAPAPRAPFARPPRGCPRPAPPRPAAGASGRSGLGAQPMVQRHCVTQVRRAASISPPTVRPRRRRTRRRPWPDGLPPARRWPAARAPTSPPRRTVLGRTEVLGAQTWQSKIFDARAGSPSSPQLGEAPVEPLARLWAMIPSSVTMSTDVGGLRAKASSRAFSTIRCAAAMSPVRYACMPSATRISPASGPLPRAGRPAPRAAVAMSHDTIAARARRARRRTT